jgi:HSP20 family protein
LVEWREARWLQTNGDTKPIIPIGHNRDVARRGWSPFDVLQREIDRLFADFGRSLPALRAPSLTPTINVSETDKEIEITAELPGLEEKDVEVNVTDNVRTIRGEKKAEKEDKGKRYHVLERSYGAFARAFDLPDGIDPGAVKAVMAKGVLKVTVPKPAPAVSKKVEIKSAA